MTTDWFIFTENNYMVSPRYGHILQNMVFPFVTLMELPCGQNPPSSDARIASELPMVTALGLYAKTLYL